GAAAQAVTISSNLVVSGGAILASGNSAGTSGQILQSNENGRAACRENAPVSAATLLSQKNIWTGPQAQTSRVTINSSAEVGAASSAVWITSNTVLNGATFYANGPVNIANATNISGALSVVNAASLGAAAQAVTISSNLVVSGGAILASGNSAGTSGQILQSN